MTIEVNPQWMGIAILYLEVGEGGDREKNFCATSKYRHHRRRKHQTRDRTGHVALVPSCPETPTTTRGGLGRDKTPYLQPAQGYVRKFRHALPTVLMYISF